MKLLVIKKNEITFRRININLSCSAQLRNVIQIVLKGGGLSEVGFCPVDDTVVRKKFN